MQIKNTFQTKLENNINSLIVTFQEEEINKISDKVAYDFLRLLAKNHDEIAQNLNEYVRIIKIIALANQRNHVTQSDLFAMLILKDDLSKKLHEDFKQKLKSTMFKELFYYLELNGEFKDSVTENFNNKNLSKQEKDNAANLFDWTSEQIKFLESKNFKEEPQLKNVITKKLVEEWIEKTKNEILARLKWQKLGFEMIKNC
ncbi:hypothetical protein ESOMN_v1c04740 [Williamsoniiplasma somnilux]|uniref:Uncharacterized protein n=1 Tax=Williamsoniiplasma somnilux TaxID=215578 RepID=A0A2K8NZ73_9MOLU|nr:hypothetical protein [Williamsoniiplasma somnilux]ATZ18856.1 hypothetical protein ESOMN_v1c04740 [Williamsoniiplasma somnilux]